MEHWVGREKWACQAWGTSKAPIHPMSPHQTYQLYDLNGFPRQKEEEGKANARPKPRCFTEFKFNETEHQAGQAKEAYVRYEETPKHQIPSTSNHQIHQLYDLLDGFQDEKRRRKSRPKWRHKQIGFQSIQGEQSWTSGRTIKISICMSGIRNLLSTDSSHVTS